MSKKIDYAKAEKLQDQTYFDCKVDMVPASLKETYSNLVVKNPVLVSRELIVDGRPLIGIEYAPDGSVVNVYTTNMKGKRVNFENAAEEKTAAAPDLIAQRLAEVRNIVPEHSAAMEVSTPAPEKKKVVTPRKLDANTAAKARSNTRA